MDSIPGVRKIPWRKKWQPTPAFLPRKTHGQRSLTGYSPWGLRVRHDLARMHLLPHHGGIHGRPEPLVSQGCTRSRSLYLGVKKTKPGSWKPTESACQQAKSGASQSLASLSLPPGVKSRINEVK